MRIRPSRIAIVLLTALAAYYAASPFLAAHTLHRAVRNGDARTIDAMIEWEPLRTSLRRTIAHNANLLPLANSAARRINPTLWQRIRSMFGHSMLDRFIERYITPAGLTELYHQKNRWHRRIDRIKRPLGGALGAGDTAQNGQQARASSWAVQAGLLPMRLLRDLRRIRHAAFITPFRFVLETEDRHKASRLIKATFALSGIGYAGIHWKLIGVAIRNEGAPAAPALKKDTASGRFAHLNGFQTSNR